ncbi:MAG: pentapeptide repeat-containing protein, partial [Planctomycetaceae bacterium]|nr:pentapeptide repeat-containing protein [Planctomycetaceae bacterium]
QLQRAQLQRAHLQRAHLQRTHLQRAHLQRAHLQRAHLQRAHLQRAHLQRAHLQRAHLQRAHLQRAHLRERDEPPGGDPGKPMQSGGPMGSIGSAFSSPLPSLDGMNCAFPARWQNDDFPFLPCRLHRTKESHYRSPCEQSNWPVINPRRILRTQPPNRKTPSLAFGLLLRPGTLRNRRSCCAFLR